GSGWQAGAQLMAVCAVPAIETRRCFSPHPTHREAFSKQMSALLGVDVIPVHQTANAIQGADIVMCATNTLDNAFFERWIRPGIHLSSIKRPEIESKALARADRIVLHSHDASPMHVTTRDLAGAEKNKERGWSTAAEL